MHQLAAAEAVVAYFLLVALMGTWDGLIRRHIRLSIEAIQWHINLRGFSAIGLGVVSLGLAVILVRLTIHYVGSMATACQGRIPCIAGRVLPPPFTTGPSAVILLIGVGLFAYWASDAGDLGGPYHRYLLAPGVWDTDKEILALVATHVRARDLPLVNDETVVEMVSWIRRSLRIFGDAARDEVTRDGHLDAKALTDVLLSTRVVRKFNLSEDALPVVLGTIADYYEEKYEQAARVWPWRRKLIPY